MGDKTENINPYHDWMYAEEHVLKTYDWDLIENHATQLLARSLNIGRVTAFVGAGTSMAYGRISWKNLVLTEHRKVWEKNEVVFPNGETAYSSTISPLDGLRDTLRDLDPTRTTVGSDRYPMIMQLCEGFDHELNVEASRLGKTKELLNDLKLSTRQRASRLTHDELGHAREILWNACFGDDPEIPSRSGDQAKKDLETQIFKLSVTERGSARAAAQYVFSSENLRSILRESQKDVAIADHPGLKEFFQQLGAWKFDPLLPPQRFIFETLLCWLERPQRQSVVKGWLPRLEDQTDKPTPSFPGRQDVIPSSRDPIRILHDRLQITRYMTTNYDREIESFFDEIGLASTTPQHGRGNPDQASTVRSRLSSFACDNRNVGKFLSFVARPRSRSVSVVHLHGESKAEESDNITFAEVDYQRRYLQDFPERDLEQGATRLAFGANPVLFIGSNMGEDDLLRSLREFMSSKEPFGERVCVAIIPAMKYRESCIEDKITLLGRYGVYAIHFGTASNTGPESDAFLWLPWQRDVAAKVENALDTLESALREASADGDAFERSKECVEGAIHASDKRVRKWAIEGPEKKAFLSDVSQMEGVTLSKEPGLSISFEISVLNAAIRFLRSSSLSQDRSNAKLIIRLCKGYLAAVRGANDSILSAFSCAALLRLRRGWNEWREQWFKEPDCRDSRRFTELEVDWKSRAGCHLSGLATLTHPLAVDHDAKSKSNHGFFAGSTSRSILGLISALKNLEEGDQKGWQTKPGRRFLWLATRRGAGKGQFFSAFQARLAELKLSEPDIAAGDEQNAIILLLEAMMPSSVNSWAGVAFFNLSFAHDVLSVFDRLEAFLSKLVEKTNSAYLRARAEFSQKNGRVAALQQAMEGFTHHRHDAGRVLVAINSLEHLFDKKGRPKNTEFKEILQIITHKDYEDAPIDFIFVVDDRPLQYGFCANPVLLNFDHNDTARCYEEAEQFRRLLGYEPASNDRPGDPPNGTKGSVPTDAQRTKTEHALFFIRTTPALLILGAYFPKLALLLLHAKKAGQLSRSESGDSRSIATLRYSDLRKLVGEVISICREKLDDDCIWLRQERETMQMILASIAFGLPQTGESTGNDKLDDILGTMRKVQQIPGSRLPSFGATTLPLPEWLTIVKNSGDSLDDVTRSLYFAVGRNRFLVTLVLAAAAKFADMRLADLNSKVADVGEDTAKFLRNICFEASSSGTNDKSNIVIEHVLRSYRYRQDRPFPGADNRHEPGSENQKGECPENETSFAGAEAFNLCLEIIWHVAIVGRPVQASVLAACPGLRKRADSVLHEKGDLQRTGIIYKFLDLCVERSFLFEISPVSRASGSRDSGERRYAVHHLMQRYIFKQMGGPNTEAIVGNQFAVSLFASQPDEMPSLESAADANIREVIASLTGYPDQQTLPLSMFYQTNTRTQRCRMLRAAHGIMRSIYSVGVLARFDPVDPSKLPIIGVMEQYRRLVRWTLKATVAHLLPYPEGPKNKSVEDDPFHLDEVIWLYNEMGVLSLVQGRLADGDAMLNQALQLLRKESEPNGFGPSSNRVHVNKALLDIERGHLDAARETLLEVYRLEDADSVVRAIADGYLGLIAHFSGDSTDAALHYGSAIDALRRFDESRACALFLRHRGDLCRSSGPAGFSESQIHLEEALRLAQRGRHEDVRHMVMLSLARLAIERREPDRKQSIHPNLDEVDRYAQITGMVRLRCEVALLRALLLMREGETRMASVECLRSLQIAAAYDMRLRTINAALLLAEICAARKLWRTARELLKFGSISARSLGDHSAVAISQRIERLLAPVD